MHTFVLRFVLRTHYIFCENWDFILKNFRIILFLFLFAGIFILLRFILQYIYLTVKFWRVPSSLLLCQRFALYYFLNHCIIFSRCVRRLFWAHNTCKYVLVQNHYFFLEVMSIYFSRKLFDKKYCLGYFFSIFLHLSWGTT